MRYYAGYLSLSLMLLFLLGCSAQTVEESSGLVNICIQKCKTSSVREQGPCILNPIPNNTDWVCDIAHSPREDVDNLPKNQCSSFREGKAHHFIELSPDCEFIRKQ